MNKIKKKNKNKNKHIEKGKRRVKKSSWKELLQIPGTFPGAFNSDIGYCGSSDNPSAFIEKGKQS